MPRSTSSTLASYTRLSEYFTVQITVPPILKSPSPSKGSLVRYSLYKLNRINDKEHSCITPLPLIPSLFTLSVALWSVSNMLISLLSHQTVQIPLAFALICSNLHDQLPSASLWSMHTIPVYVQMPSASLWSMHTIPVHVQMPSASLWSMHTIPVYVQISFICYSQHSGCIPIPLHLINSNWSSPNTSSIFLSAPAQSDTGYYC